MTYLSTVPPKKTFTHKVLMSQQLPTKYFTAMASTQTSLIFGMPAGFQVTAVKLVLLTQFVLPGSTSFTVGIGPAVSGAMNDTTFYATPFELTNVGTPTSLQITHTDFTDDDGDDSLGLGVQNVIQGAHDIYAYFTANGHGYISTLTQGELEVTIQYRLV